jgi:hypothetical protein
MVLKLVLLFASLLAIPLARQSCLDATLLAGLQVVGVTLDFFDDVLLLYLPLESAQRIFERLAFLYANLCQSVPPPYLPNGFLYDTGKLGPWRKRGWYFVKNPFDRVIFLPNNSPIFHFGSIWRNSSFPSYFNACLMMIFEEIFKMLIHRFNFQIQ